MSCSRRFWVLACVISCGFAAFATAQPPGQPKQPGKGKEPPAQPRTLPKDAVARLGQTRLRHADRASAIAFAPDGKTFVTGGDDGTIRVWSVATGDQVNLYQKPGFTVSTLRYTHGGKRLAVQFGADGEIRFLDSVTLKELHTVALPNKVHYAFSTDGEYIASSDVMGNVIIAETETDLPKLELANVNIFAFRPDAKAIAVADSKGTLTVHLLTGGKPIFTTKHDGVILGIVYSPDGKKVAVGSRGGNGNDVVAIYEEGKAKPVAEIEGMNIPRAWISNDALACGNGGEAGVYNLAKRDWEGRIKGVTGDFAVSPDGSKLAATGSGLRVRLWELKTGKQLHAENDSFPDPALLVGSPDGGSLFLLTTDTAYLWALDANAAKPAGTLPGRAVSAMVGGDKLVVATPDAVVVYDKFDPTKPLPAKPTHTFKDSAGAKNVAVNAKGTRIAWAVEGGKITVTDPEDKFPRRTLPVTTTTILAIGFNPVGDRLGVLGRDPFLRVWDVSDELTEVKEVWKARIQRGVKGVVTFSPDGRYVTAVSTTQLLVFDAADGKDELRIASHQFERYTDQGQIQHASFSPDGRLLIVGATGMYGRVEVWELATRTMVRAFTTGYGGTSRLCIFPDGKRVASSGAEEAVTVWDLTMRGGKLPPKAEDLAGALKDLSSLDASVGYPAVKLFASAGNQGTEALDRAMKDIIANEKKIKGWIEDLGSETFSVRENASKELLAQGARALPAVTLAVQSEDPEVRDRAKEVLGKLNAKGQFLLPNGLTADSLMLVRSVQSLEEIGTTEAQSVLRLIADTGGRPGEEAKAALERLKKK